MWVGCTCKVCGTVRGEEHSWDGCKCSRCLTTRDEGHNWDGCLCSRCGRKRDAEHDWDGCVCRRCGASRDVEHAWQRLSGRSLEECGKCKKKRTVQCEWSGARTDLHDDRARLEEVTAPEMIAIGSMVRRYASGKYSAGPRWIGGWLRVCDIDHEREIVCTSDYDGGKRDEYTFGDMFFGYNGCDHVHCYIPSDRSRPCGDVPDFQSKPKGEAATLPASELIDYIVAHRSDPEVSSLTSSLAAKLSDGFYSDPQAIEKALRIFGDSEMVNRFRQIQTEMKPSDLGLLIPDVVRAYLARFR